MKKTALPFTPSENALSVQELSRHVDDWLISSEISQHSPRTIAARRLALEKFLWFLREQGYAHCGVAEVKRFFAYLNHGHLQPGGRWGNQAQTKPLRPTTVQTFHKHLQTLFNWMLKEEIIETSPMKKIPPIVACPDQILPFSTEQLQALLQAARTSMHSRRDEALIYFLVDTGLRATELCSLRVQDIDYANRQCLVLGKGNKYRTVCFGATTAKVLWKYLREEKQEPTSPLFLADRGTRAGDPLTRSGLFQLIQRLGVKAGIRVTRCSPHTFRNTFAVQFLRNGGNSFTLKQILGHTDLKMTNRYVALAEADIQNQHRQFSPGDRLKKN